MNSSFFISAISLYLSAIRRNAKRKTPADVFFVSGGLLTELPLDHGMMAAGLFSPAATTTVAAIGGLGRRAISGRQA